MLAWASPDTGNMGLWGRSHVQPNPLTQLGARAIVLLILATTVYVLFQYNSLPWLLPVHFRADGAPNGWQYKTPGRVFTPVLVQFALTFALGGIAALLLSRKEPADPAAPDVKAAATAAEAVVLTTVIWVAFQSFAAFSLIQMWTREHGDLGSTYVWIELAGLLLTAVVGVRAKVHLGRPEPLPYVAHHWRFKQLYKNADDPALFVPTRDGSRWTLNFGRPVAVALLGTILLAGAAIPTLILVLALRS